MAETKHNLQTVPVLNLSMLGVGAEVELDAEGNLVAPGTIDDDDLLAFENNTSFKIFKSNANKRFKVSQVKPTRHAVLGNFTFQEVAAKIKVNLNTPKPKIDIVKGIHLNSKLTSVSQSIEKCDDNQNNDTCEGLKTIDSHMLAGKTITLPGSSPQNKNIKIKFIDGKEASSCKKINNLIKLRGVKLNSKFFVTDKVSDPASTDLLEKQPIHPKYKEYGLNSDKTQDDTKSENVLHSSTEVGSSNNSLQDGLQQQKFEKVIVLGVNQPIFSTAHYQSVDLDKVADGRRINHNTKNANSKLNMFQSDIFQSTTEIKKELSDTSIALGVDCTFSNKLTILSEVASGQLSISDPVNNRCEEEKKNDQLVNNVKKPSDRKHISDEQEKGDMTATAKQFIPVKEISEVINLRNKSISDGTSFTRTKREKKAAHNFAWCTQYTTDVPESTVLIHNSKTKLRNENNIACQNALRKTEVNIQESSVHCSGDSVQRTSNLNINSVSCNEKSLSVPSVSLLNSFPSSDNTELFREQVINHFEVNNTQSKKKNVSNQSACAEKDVGKITLPLTMKTCCVALEKLNLSFDYSMMSSYMSNPPHESNKTISSNWSDGGKFCAENIAEVKETDKCKSMSNVFSTGKDISSQENTTDQQKFILKYSDGKATVLNCDQVRNFKYSHSESKKIEHNIEENNSHLKHGSTQISMTTVREYTNAPVIKKTKRMQTKRISQLKGFQQNVNQVKSQISSDNKTKDYDVQREVKLKGNVCMVGTTLNSEITANGLQINYESLKVKLETLKESSSPTNKVEHALTVNIKEDVQDSVYAPVIKKSVYATRKSNKSVLRMDDIRLNVNQLKPMKTTLSSDKKTDNKSMDINSKFPGIIVNKESTVNPEVTANADQSTCEIPNLKLQAIEENILGPVIRKRRGRPRKNVLLLNDSRSDMNRVKPIEINVPSDKRTDQNSLEINSKLSENVKKDSILHNQSTISDIQNKCEILKVKFQPVKEYNQNCKYGPIMKKRRGRPRKKVVQLHKSKPAINELNLLENSLEIDSKLSQNIYKKGSTELQQVEFQCIEKTNVTTNIAEHESKDIKIKSVQVTKPDLSVPARKKPRGRPRKNYLMNGSSPVMSRSTVLKSKTMLSLDNKTNQNVTQDKCREYSEMSYTTAAILRNKNPESEQNTSPSLKKISNRKNQQNKISEKYEEDDTIKNNNLFSSSDNLIELLPNKTLRSSKNLLLPAVVNKNHKIHAISKSKIRSANAFSKSLENLTCLSNSVEKQVCYIKSRGSIKSTKGNNNKSLKCSKSNTNPKDLKCTTSYERRATRSSQSLNISIMDTSGNDTSAIETLSLKMCQNISDANQTVNTQVMEIDQSKLPLKTRNLRKTQFEHKQGNSLNINQYTSAVNIPQIEEQHQCSNSDSNKYSNRTNISTKVPRLSTSRTLKRKLQSDCNQSFNNASQKRQYKNNSLLGMNKSHLKEQPDRHEVWPVNEESELILETALDNSLLRKSTQYKYKKISSLTKRRKEEGNHAKGLSSKGKAVASSPVDTYNNTFGEENILNQSNCDAKTKHIQNKYSNNGDNITEIVFFHPSCENSNFKSASFDFPCQPKPVNMAQFPACIEVPNTFFGSAGNNTPVTLNTLQQQPASCNSIQSENYTVAGSNTIHTSSHITNNILLCQKVPGEARTNYQHHENQSTINFNPQVNFVNCNISPQANSPGIISEQDQSSLASSTLPKDDTSEKLKYPLQSSWSREPRQLAFRKRKRRVSSSVNSDEKRCDDTEIQCAKKIISVPGSTSQPDKKLLKIMNYLRSVQRSPEVTIIKKPSTDEMDYSPFRNVTQLNQRSSSELGTSTHYKTIISECSLENIDKNTSSKERRNQETDCSPTHCDESNTSGFHDNDLAQSIEAEEPMFPLSVIIDAVK